jgi:hypothetical protein
MLIPTSGITAGRPVSAVIATIIGAGTRMAGISPVPGLDFQTMTGVPGVVVRFTDTQGIAAVPGIPGRIGNRVKANKHTGQTTGKNN